MNRMYLMMSRSGIFDHLHRFVGSDPPSIRFRRMEHLLRCVSMKILIHLTFKQISNYSDARARTFRICPTDHVTLTNFTK